MGHRAFQLFSRSFRLAYGGTYRRFLADLEAPRQAQDKLLSELVAAMSDTRYGRQHGLRRNDGYDEFARKLPIVDYDGLRPWVELQRRSSDAVLCAGGATFYERTSGSSGAAKHIPYTKALQRSFARMFILWACDFFENGPRLHSGRTFISVSPDVRAPHDVGALQDDRDYLPPLLRALIGSFLVLPRGLRAVRDPAKFMRILAAHLLDARELEVVSIWSPSYFSSLLGFIRDHRAQIACDLVAGEVVECGAPAFQLPRAGAARRLQTAEMLQAGAPDFAAIWPQLKLLSCWTDGNAGMVLEPLRRQLPQAVLQGKGLVATEAPITIPLWQCTAPVPLLSEVFLEFCGDDGRVCRLDEVRPGARYELVISQRGGLARYRIGDRVEVAGSIGATPTLRFIGRVRDVSDLVGEKLHETFVRDALAGEPRLAQRRWMLLPSVARGTARYICLLDGPRAADDLALVIDARLQDAHHYRLARELGQLAPLAVQRLENVDAAFFAWNLAGGRAWGTVKPCAVLSDAGRAESFLRWIQS